MADGPIRVERRSNQRAIGAEGIDQRRAVVNFYLLDLAHENRVIASVKSGMSGALQVGEDAGEERRMEAAGAPIQAGETVLAAARKVLRQLTLLRA